MAAEGYKSILLNECLGKGSPLHEPPKSGETPNPSPVKQAKPAALLVVQRFLHDCLVECYKKTYDYENLKLWIGNSDEIVKDSSGSTNGTNFEKFYHHSCTRQDVEFVKSLDDVFVNRDRKYQSKNEKMNAADAFLPIETDTNVSMNDFNLFSTFPNIQYIDTSILEAKISYVHNKDHYRDFKKTLSQLCDWTSMENHMNFEDAKSWSVYSLTETLRNKLIKNCVLVNMGKKLENNSCVLQMNENNKIEIDLHFKLLLESWGVRNYDFELSNILKEIKECYVKNKASAREEIGKCSTVIDALVRESLRSGTNELSQEMIILSYVSRNLLDDLDQAQNLRFKTQEKFPSNVLLTINFWKKLFSEDDINVNVVKSARKEGNFNLSKRALLWHFENQNSDKNLIEISDDLIENFDRNLRVEEGELCLQVAKLLHR